MTLFSFVCTLKHLSIIAISKKNNWPLSNCRQSFQPSCENRYRPFVDGGQYKYAKIVNRKLLSDSVRVRDIAFSFDNVKSQEEAMVKRKLFDSVFTQIDSFKQDFGQMAAMFSDDQQTKVVGGDKGWVKFGETDKPYNDAIFLPGKKGMVKNGRQLVTHRSSY